MNVFTNEKETGGQRALYGITRGQMLLTIKGLVLGRLNEEGHARNIANAKEKIKMWRTLTEIY
jgi:hypothetical protein